MATDPVELSSQLSISRSFTEEADTINVEIRKLIHLAQKSLPLRFLRFSDIVDVVFFTDSQEMRPKFDEKRKNKLEK